MSSVALAAVNVGDTPTYSFKSTKGQTVSNESLKGKLVLIDFWATWCGPCMAEADHMVATNAKYKDRGLQIVGVSLDENRTKMDATAKNLKFDWPQYFDGNVWKTKMAQEWGVNSIPRTFLISPEGKVLWTGHPGNMDPAIERAMKEHAPKLVEPTVLGAVGTALDAAEASVGSNPAATLVALSQIPSEVLKDGGVRERVTKLQASLEPHAQQALADAEGLIKEKNYTDGLGVVQTVSAAMAGTPTGKKAADKLDELKKDPAVKAELQALADAKAAEADLAVAQQLQSDKKDEQAYVKFKAITKQYAKSPAAATAAEAVATYEKDPAFVKRANESAAGGKAKGMIGLAQSYASAGKKDQARQKYQDVIDQFPGTTYAETAKKELAALK
jgi:thiol-disulfide isomerase/thioredoxin